MAGARLCCLSQSEASCQTTRPICWGIGRLTQRSSNCRVERQNALTFLMLSAFQRQVLSARAKVTPS